MTTTRRYMDKSYEQTLLTAIRELSLRCSAVSIPALRQSVSGRMSAAQFDVALWTLTRDAQIDLHAHDDVARLSSYGLTREACYCRGERVYNVLCVRS